MAKWLHVLACVLVPCAVGGVMYALFDAWNRRRSPVDGELPPVDYQI